MRPLAFDEIRILRFSNCRISHFKENHLLGLCAGISRLKNSALPGGEAESARFVSKISHQLDNQSKPSELSTVLFIVARDGKSNERF